MAGLLFLKVFLVWPIWFLTRRLVILMFVPLYIMPFLLLWVYHWFSANDYDVPEMDAIFLFCSSRHLLSFLGVWVDSFHKFGEIAIYYFFKCFLSPSSYSSGTLVTCMLDIFMSPHRSLCSAAFLLSLFPTQCFILGSFHCCLLKLTDLFFCIVWSAINLIQRAFHFR